MKFDPTVIDAFIEKCASEGMTDDEIMDAYVIHCGNEAMNDPSFRSGFENVFRKQSSTCSLDLSSIEFRRLLGSMLVSELIEDQ